MFLIAGDTSTLIAFKSQKRCRIAELTGIFLGQSFMLKPSSSSHYLLDLQTYSLMAINGFRLDSPLSVYISSSLHHPLTHSSLFLLFFLLLPTRPSTYSPCYQPPPSLPLSHFPPLIHLSDFTRTQGDPGQTSCRGNRQSRNILYFFFFFLQREERLKSI